MSTLNTRTWSTQVGTGLAMNLACVYCKKVSRYTCIEKLQLTGYLTTGFGISNPNQAAYVDIYKSYYIMGDKLLLNFCVKF